MRSTPRPGFELDGSVRSARVVKVDVAADALSRRAHGLADVQVDLLVLDRAPHPLDENVIAPTALAVHRDADAVLLQQAGERAVGELGGFNRSSQHLQSRRC